MKKKYNFPGEVSMFMHEIRMSGSMYAREKKRVVVTVTR